MVALGRRIHILGWPAVGILLATAAWMFIAGHGAVGFVALIAAIALSAHLLRTAIMPDTSMGYEEWLKGGVRYRKLKRVLPGAVSDLPLGEFFVVRHGNPNMTIAYLVPFAFLGLKEYVVAQGAGRVYLFRIHGIPIVSARIGKPLQSWPLAEAPLQVKERTAELDGVAYTIAPYHEDSAATVAQAVKQAKNAVGR